MIGLEPTGSVTVTFHGDREAEGPLTFAQLDTLAWVTEPDDAASALLRWTFELPDRCTMADVTAAFAILMARHEALRTTYLIAETPTQRIARSGELVIPSYRIIGDFDQDDQDKVAQQLHDELCEQGIDFTVELPLRVAVASVGESPHVAVAVYSHMAADFGTTVVIGRQFTELAGDPAARVVGPAAHQPFDQAHLENSPRGRRRSDAAIRYWRTHISHAPHAVCTLPAPSGDAMGLGHRSCILVSPAAALALGRIEARTRQGRQSIVLAAICALLARRTAVDSLAFASISGNRFHSRLSEYVGDLAQDSLIALNLDVAGFDELIGRTAGATLTANANSSYNPHALNAMLDEVGHARGAAFTRDFVVNNLSIHLNAAPPNRPADQPLADAAEIAQALELSRLTWRPAPDFPEILLCAPIRVDSEFIFTLTGNTTYVGETELEQLTRGLERLIVAAADRDIPLTDLGTVTGVEPTLRGPDWAQIGPSFTHLPAVHQLLLDALNTPAAHVVANPPTPGTQNPPTLTAYLTATDAIRSPHQAHLACMDLLAEPGRHLAIAPTHYVLCDGVPDDPTDESSWQRLPTVASGNGRQAYERALVTGAD